MCFTERSKDVYCEQSEEVYCKQSEQGIIPRKARRVRSEGGIASEASNLTIERSEQGITSEATLYIVIKNSYKYNNIILCNVFCNTAAQVSQS